MLTVSALHVAYGPIAVLGGVDLHAAAGRITALIGANGAGKTTTLHAISGLVGAASGSIIMEGAELVGLPPEQIVRRGVVHVPEGRRVFRNLTVHECLRVGGYTRRDKHEVAASIERMYGLFPRLAERRRQLAGTLSGGEQQMLAFARALVAQPRLLLLDEPSMGLSPKIAAELARLIVAIRDQGITILLVEQNAMLALEIAETGYVMESGRIAQSAPARDLLSDGRVRKAYLGACPSTKEIKVDATELHRDAIIIDGLMISKWSRSVFEHMHRGGLTAINCTCSVWDGFQGTMENIAQWKAWFRDNSDILLQVHTTADIRRAKAENKVGIILGWQNTSGIEDRLEFLPLFRDLGVRVMQLTYNTQNWVGTGCWESRDGGLSDFGRDVIDEMNRLGILVDLSHVGPKTSEDAIRHSRKPVAVTHGCPAAMLPHARNKTDAQIKLLAHHGGFIGFATYTPFLPKGPNTTVDDCIIGIEHLIGIAGEDQVGIGTDFTQDQDTAFFAYLGSDKGTGRRVTSGYAEVPPQPKGLEKIENFGNLTKAMVARGWPEARIRKVMGENWLRFLGEVWGA